MSRLDNLGEILDGYEGREYKSNGYLPSEEDIKKIHESMTEEKDTFVKLGYIACKQDTFVDVSCPVALYMDGPKLPIIPDTAMYVTLKQIKEKNLDFAGVVFYTAEMHPVEFMNKEVPDEKKFVPDGVKMPDLVLIIDRERRYTMLQGGEVYDDFSGVTGS